MLFWYQILKFILFDMRNERDSVVVGIVWCWRSIACFRLLASLPYMSICTRYIILWKAAALFIRYKISKLIPFCCLCLIKALTTPCMHCRHAAIWNFLRGYNSTNRNWILSFCTQWSQALRHCIHIHIQVNSRYLQQVHSTYHCLLFRLDNRDIYLNHKADSFFLR